MTRKTAIMLSAMAVLTMSLAGSAQAGQCRDPWVTQAIQQVSGHAPTGNYETGDCNIRNFNNGSWGSYPELLGYVQKYYGGGARLPSPSAFASGQLRDPSKIVAGGGGNWGNKNPLIGDGGGT